MWWMAAVAEQRSQDLYDEAALRRTARAVPPEPGLRTQLSRAAGGVLLPLALRMLASGRSALAAERQPACCLPSERTTR